MCQPRYKDILAVDQISFSGEPGELVGYIAVIGLIMMVLIPYGFASFYPARYLLGREVGALAWLAPLIAGVLAVSSCRVWLFGLKHYGGTGS